MDETTAQRVPGGATSQRPVGMAPCGDCGNPASPGHVCPDCGVVMHGCCGVGVGEEGYGQPRRCKDCVDTAAVHAAVQGAIKRVRERESGRAATAATPPPKKRNGKGRAQPSPPAAQPLSKRRTQRLRRGASAPPQAPVALLCCEYLPAAGAAVCGRPIAQSCGQQQCGKALCSQHYLSPCPHIMGTLLELPPCSRPLFPAIGPFREPAADGGASDHNGGGSDHNGGASEHNGGASDHNSGANNHGGGAASTGGAGPTAAAAASNGAMLRGEVYSVTIDKAKDDIPLVWFRNMQDLINSCERGGASLERGERAHNLHIQVIRKPSKDFLLRSTVCCITSTKLWRNNCSLNFLLFLLRDLLLGGSANAAWHICQRCEGVSRVHPQEMRHGQGPGENHRQGLRRRTNISRDVRYVALQVEKL